MNTASMKLLYLVVLMGCCGQGSAQIQSCYNANGCGGSEVSSVSNASDCCLGRGLSFRNGSGACQQCIALSQCEAGVDLYFVIDSTLTLGSDGHAAMRRWAANLVDDFAIGTSNSTDLTGLARVGVIQFWGRSPFRSNPDSQATVDIELGNYADKDDLKQQIENLEYENGRSTIIPHGLAKLNEEIDNHYDSRRSIYALVLTDGIDDSTPSNRANLCVGTLEEEADEIKAKENVEVFAIGFGARTNLSNLATIASQEGTIIIAEDVGAALNITYNRLITLPCPNIPPRPTPGSAQFQSCHDATGCGGNEVNVSSARDCCLGSGFSFQDQSSRCRQCIAVTAVTVEFDPMSYTVSESDCYANITIVKRGLTTQTVSVTFTTADGSATAGEDYTATSQTVTFAPTEMSKIVMVPIRNDNIFEGLEQFTAQLSIPACETRVMLGAAMAMVDITDDDTVTVEFDPTSYTVSESDRYANITVVKRGQTTQTVSVTFTTADGSATAGEDYTATSQTVTFAPTEMSKIVMVPIRNDNIFEGLEQFTAQLSIPAGETGVMLGAAMATVDITDDDTVTVEFDPTSYTVSESDRYANITVVKRGQTTQTVSVTFTTADGSATAGEDYTATSQTVTFAPTEMSKIVMVPIRNDNIFEGLEQFTAQLSIPAGETGVMLGAAMATVDITDDDTVTVEFDPTSYTVSESDRYANITVVKRGQTTQTVSVEFRTFSTADGRAIAGEDYNTISQTVTFVLAQTSELAMVPITDDSVGEGVEQFFAQLFVPAGQSGVVLGADMATVEIADDDSVKVEFDRANYTVFESDRYANIIIVKRRQTTQTVTVDFTTVDGSATAGEDYTTTSRSVTFAPMETFQIVMVPIREDQRVELDETFAGQLTLPSGSLAVVLGAETTATVTIQDNDMPTPQLSTLVSYSMTPSPPQTAGPTQEDVGVILGSTFAAIVVVILCIGIAIIATVYLRRKQRAKKVDLTRIDEMKEMNPYIAQKSQVTHDPHTDVPKLLISSNSIRLLNVVGQGEFGVVYKAHLVKSMQQMPETVAVKTLKGFFDQRSAAVMMKESVKMQGFEHPHVLNVTGVCLDAGLAPYIIMPFMANGSLLAYVKKEKMNLVIPNDAADDELATVARKRLADMCIQIGKGMEYLASKKIVHRDLAARNCMIDAHFVIKVADFGLSENMYSKTYFRQGKDQSVKLPVKWLALEAMTEGVFSEKSDVWSYGVTCWELFTGGRVPYPGVDPFSLPKLLESGHRLDKPNNAACSEEIYLFMLKCWHGDPEERPTFSELVSLMSQTLESLAGYMDVSTFGKLEVHGEDPHNEDPHNEGPCDEGTRDVSPHDDGTDDKATDGEDPHSETEV